jgi:hypothetical protein
MGSSSGAVALGAVLAAACLIALAARAGSAALRVSCPARAFSVDFRPKGDATEHRPNVKLYAKRTFLGQVFPGRLSFGPACKAVTDTKKISWDGGRARSTGKSVTIRCSVLVKPQLRGGPLVGSGGTFAGNLLVATLGHSSRVFLRATIEKTGSRLRFDTRYCKKH